MEDDDGEMMIVSLAWIQVKLRLMKVLDVCLYVLWCNTSSVASKEMLRKVIMEDDDGEMMIVSLAWIQVKLRLMKVLDVCLYVLWCNTSSVASTEMLRKGPLKGCQTSGLWARIVGTMYHLHSSGILSLNSFRFKVGVGSLIRFWKDTWLGETPLSTRYNRLFHLEKDHNCLMRDRIVNGSWSLDWRRPVNVGRTYADLNNLLVEISYLVINVDGDSCIWPFSNDCNFWSLTLGSILMIVCSLVRSQTQDGVREYRILEKQKHATQFFFMNQQSVSSPVINPRYRLNWFKMEIGRTEPLFSARSPICTALIIPIGFGSGDNLPWAQAFKPASSAYGTCSRISKAGRLKRVWDLGLKWRLKWVRLGAEVGLKWVRLCDEMTAEVEIQDAVEWFNNKNFNRTIIGEMKSWYVKNFAKTRQPIVCTIYGPSNDIFEAFDEVMMTNQRGGLRMNIHALKKLDSQVHHEGVLLLFMGNTCRRSFRVKDTNSLNQQEKRSTKRCGCARECQKKEAKDAADSLKDAMSRNVGRQKLWLTRSLKKLQQCHCYEILVL
ncbi:RNA-directed DNA polymerase, eukaryota, Reverse transcriptase zinc-binding domain protein [Artemisia annua]|uniref:RNA-directed DNA polymerase, eukaryota, Reverse transcriptase zinc-binding domain protein n=1 Tax=Artemisia annua TaxID=35608 RepID=A0A2U1MTV5_ARTAN|nr:RNA-directed DNA polymerase, eukaryota, Reverse transcriptase zinc-binding domain protein [Artemisia annua]